MKNIQLCKMYTLMYGQTWYGKYGFMLCQPDTYIIDNIKLINYNKNKLIMNNMKLKDFPLMKTYLQKYIKSEYNSNIKLNKTKFINIIKLYNHFNDNNKLLKDFIKEFLINFDETCLIFYSFYEDLYNKLGLTDFYKHSYVKFIL